LSKPINIVAATGQTDGDLSSHPIDPVTTTLENTLVFGIMSCDGGDLFPFSVSGTGWSKFSEIQSGSGNGDNASVIATKELGSAGSTGTVTITSALTDGSARYQFAIAPPKRRTFIMNKLGSSEGLIMDGFGSGTTGGTGGTALTVTNLNTSGAGSLQTHAATASGTRIVKFTTSGTIDYGGDGELEIANDNITVDGSDAPNGGICLRGANLRIKASNVIFRHLRVRLGDDGAIDYDTLSIRGSAAAISNVVFANCSFSWSIDELIGISGTSFSNADITFQDCMFSEPLHNAHHTEGNHAFNTLLQGTNTRISFIRGLYAHSTSRHLRLSTGANTVEFINNVVYNFIETYQFNDGSTFDMINNHFKEGSLTITSSALAENVEDATLSTYHISGNTNDGGLDEMRSAMVSENSGSRVTTGTYIPLSVADAITHVLANAGATLPKRDAVDLRIIDDYNNTTGNRIDSPSDVGGYPDLTS